MKPQNKNQVRHADFEQALISWRAPEHSYHEKSKRWFLIAGIFIILLIIYGILTDGWTFSVAVIVLAATYYLFYRNQPAIVDVKISNIGIKIGPHLFPYSLLRGFWIVYDPPHVKKLYIRTVSAFHPDISVPLDDVDPAEVRRILGKHLEEFKGRHEPFSDSLTRLLRL